MELRDGIGSGCTATKDGEDLREHQPTPLCPHGPHLHCSWPPLGVLGGLFYAYLEIGEAGNGEVAPFRCK